MTKNQVRISLILFFIIFSFNSIAQDQLEKSIEVDKTIEVKSSRIFRVTEAYYLNQTDTINILESIGNETLSVSLTPSLNLNSDSIYIVIGNLQKAFFAGQVIYTNSIKSNDERNDIYKGEGMSIFSKNIQSLDFVIGEIPKSKELHGRKYYSFWVYNDDLSTLLFNCYEYIDLK